MQNNRSLQRATIRITVFSHAIRKKDLRRGCRTANLTNLTHYKMKKLALISMLALCASMAHADYQSMVFRMSDGTEQTVSLDGITLSFADGNLVVKNNATNLSLPLTSLTSMEFSTVTTGVEALPAEIAGAVAVYSLDGVSLGEFENLAVAESNLGKGTYVFAFKNGQTLKITLTK